MSADELQMRTQREPQSFGDALGRRFRDLRISLTDRCDLACIYCVPDDAAHGQHSAPAADTLLAQVHRLHERLDLQTVRLTGGEPLLYRELARLVRGIKDMGIPRVALTTNGTLLERNATQLRAAGLDDLNVSLDAVGETAFRRVSRRRNVVRVIEGIRAAVVAGLTLKLNCTVYRGGNEDEILPLLDFAGELGVTIRYLELMNMGHLFADYKQHFFSESEILARISAGSAVSSEPREPGATARYWKTAAGQRFGIIANHSAPFCGDCDRLRLDSRGRLYGCISAAPEQGLPLPEAPRQPDPGQTHPPAQAHSGELNGSDPLGACLTGAMAHKRTQHFTGSRQSMLAIGG